MLDPLLLENVRLRAMKAVLEREPGFLLRQIQRWYSHQFHTPLHLVEDLDDADVLQAYFEDKFAGASFDERIEQLDDALETPEVAAERLRNQGLEEADAAFGQKIAEAQRAAEEEAIAKAKAAKEKDKKLQVIPKPLPGRQLRTSLPEPGLEGFGANGKPKQVPDSIPEDVKVVFCTEEELLAEAEGNGAVPAPKPRQS